MGISYSTKVNSDELGRTRTYYVLSSRFCLSLVSFLAFLGAVSGFATGASAARFGLGAVWVTSTEKSVASRINPLNHLVEAEIEVDEKPRFIAVGEGFVWTLNQGKGTVSKIDPKLNKVVATIEVGIPGGGGEIAAGDGSVWVTAFQFPVSRIDPETNKVTYQLAGPGGDAIAVGHKSVWLSNLREQNVWRFPPHRAGGKELD